MIVGVAKVLNSFSEGGVEALDGVDEPEEADLLDVLERLAAVGEAPGDEVDEVGVQLDELLADAGSRVSRYSLSSRRTRSRRALGAGLGMVRRSRWRPPRPHGATGSRSLVFRQPDAETTGALVDPVAVVVDEQPHEPERQVGGRRHLLALSLDRLATPLCAARRARDLAIAQLLCTCTSRRSPSTLKMRRICPPSMPPTAPRQAMAFSHAWATAMVRSCTASTSKPATAAKAEAARLATTMCAGSAGRRSSETWSHPGGEIPLARSPNSDGPAPRRSTARTPAQHGVRAWRRALIDRPGDLASHSRASASSGGVPARARRTQHP